MKKIFSFLAISIVCYSLVGQNVRETYYQTWKKRVDTDGSAPTKERQYVYEDKMKAWWSGNPNIPEGSTWLDEIISIKEVWSIKPEGNSQWFARILTKNAGAPFYVEYDPLSPNWGVWFFVVPELFPTKFQQWCKDETTKMESQKISDEANIAKNEAIKKEMFENAIQVGWNKVCQISLDYLKQKYWPKMKIIEAEALKEVKKEDAINNIRNLSDSYVQYSLDVFDSTRTSDKSKSQSHDFESYLRIYQPSTGGYDPFNSANQYFNDLSLKYFDNILNWYSNEISKIVLNNKPSPEEIALENYKTSPDAIFLDKNKEKKGVITTSSGLQYEVIKMGKGAKPTPEQNISILYSISLIDSKILDAKLDPKNPVQFAANVFLPGFTEGIQLMPVGSKFRFYIPQDLAFGVKGGGLAPPLATLIMEVELLKILK
jgi:FKBP-type peptidyl-prolyl cis-trans isomerase